MLNGTVNDAAGFAPANATAIPVHPVTAEALDTWLADQPEHARRWLKAMDFKAGAGQVVTVPGKGGEIEMAAAGLGGAEARRRTRFALGTAAAKLPPGTYRIAGDHPPGFLSEQALGWLLAGYRFNRFRQSGKSDEAPAQAARLQAPDGIDTRLIEIVAAGESLTRDLINTPASHMGPEDLETTVLALGEEFDAQVSVTYGDDLLHANFPLIHAVGRASDRMPRLLDLRWGQEGPRLTLVGKGVCFDTGGLDIKPPSNMLLMKKDMAGAAVVFGLARAIALLALPVRLRVLVPAVENSISGGAFRPGDVLTSRKGLTVEIGNTDAEGRLVLADALAAADAEGPALLIDLATLTGAARVAVGPDLPALFTADDALATDLRAIGQAEFDPVWRLPLHAPYRELLKTPMADISSTGSSGFAGACTAALFLQEFVGKDRLWAHFDIYGHNPSDRPGRPKGGEASALRAVFGLIERRFGEDGAR